MSESASRKCVRRRTDSGSVCDDRRVLDDRSVVTALAACQEPHAVGRSLAHYFKRDCVVARLIDAGGASAPTIRRELLHWLLAHEGGTTPVKGKHEQPTGPLPVVQYAWLAERAWEGLLAEYAPPASDA